jgi:uncharacterized protein (TIGR00255 family)
MPIASMTGFGSGSATDGAEQITIELRSVNAKFCEVKARLPRELAPLESALVKLLKERIARGTIDALVRRTTAGALSAEPQVNTALVNAYTTALRRAARDAGLAEDLALRDLLPLEGIVRLEERPPDVASAERALTAASDTAVAALVTVRRREGAALEVDLRTRAAGIRNLIGRVSTGAPASVAAYRERLAERVKEILGEVNIDPGRLEQEVVLFADRSDVTEELVRLGTHISEMERLLSRDGPVGRQLDFLIQEMHREANTIGSKSASAEIAQIVVELKAEIERMREQVQNVE